jgi:crotonobetainyl-CoA:carnitine CoA-transferase CaiB-like acyl-CoA transferase
VASICGDLNVLELGAGSTAASMAGMVLADAGARVLKVEPPEGDRLRTALPSGFLVWNRGKESIVADLRTEEGRRVVRELAAAADVVIDAFSPGTTDAWGIGCDDLRALNTGLVHCSITAFGRTGPYARLKGYEALVAAKAGLFSRGAFGHRAGAIMYPVQWGGFGAAMQATAGIIGALLTREQTGRGQSLDATLVAGLDPVDYFMTVVWQLTTRKGEAPPLDARSALTASRYGVLVCTKDGRFVQTSTLLPHQGKALTVAAGRADVLDDPRFANLPMFATPDDAQAWEDILWEAFRAHDLAHWLPVLEASPDIAFEVSRTSEEGLDHPQIVHNGDAIVIDDPTHGPIQQVGPIGHFAATPLAIARTAPSLGANDGPFLPRSAGVGFDGVAPVHPYAGVTIVEFGYFYAMPYGLAMAAAMGARVIKLEDAKGDPHRSSFGQEVASTKTTAGKESLSVDLSTAQGREIARRVIAEADVFVTGFRSGVAERLGLGYAELAAINPRLLYVHAAGYGVDGPYAHRALYAQAAQAVAGSFGRQVGYWADPERNVGMSVIELQAVVQPRLNQIVDGDSNAALAVLAATALGVYHQRRTGRGQFLSTSMIAGNAWAYSDDFCRFAGKTPLAVCDSDYYGVCALYRVYEAAEGWICLAVTTEREWHDFTATAELAELAADRRFATASARAAHDAELTAALTDQFARRPAAEWEAMLSAVDVGCVQVFMGGQPAFTSTDLVLRATGLTLEEEHPLFGTVVRAAPPVAFSETPARVAPPCVRGQHNHAILTELGYSDDDITAFEKDGVVIPPG